MKKVYGAYLCTGCGIGNVLDVDGLKDAATDAGIAMQDHGCLCGADGRAFIEKDIAEKGEHNCRVRLFSTGHAAGI